MRNLSADNNYRLEHFVPAALSHSPTSIEQESWARRGRGRGREGGRILMIKQEITLFWGSFIHIFAIS